MRNRVEPPQGHVFRGPRGPEGERQELPLRELGTPKATVLAPWDLKGTASLGLWGVHYPMRFFLSMRKLGVWNPKSTQSDLWEETRGSGFKETRWKKAGIPGFPVTG